MTTKLNSRLSARVLPSGLADVALIDALTCAATGGMSVSWWQEEVRTGRAPAPALRAPRCTRWRLSEVRDFWIARASNGDGESVAAAARRGRSGSTFSASGSGRSEQSVAASAATTLVQSPQ